jgi:hypothetical protein
MATNSKTQNTDFFTNATDEYKKDVRLFELKMESLSHIAPGQAAGIMAAVQYETTKQQEKIS